MEYARSVVKIGEIGISEEGRTFLEAHKLLRAEETLRAIYSRIEKTDEIQRYENAPRPDR